MLRPLGSQMEPIFFPTGNWDIKLRWLKTVSSAYIWMGCYNHSLSLDALIMVSKNFPIIGEHVGIIFLTQ